MNAPENQPALLSPERVAETPKPLPYKQRMSLTQEALAGLPAHTNDAAHFQGQRGYWVQGEAVFIPASNPATAIAFYRQRFNAADIATSHNLATAAVGRMKAAVALDEFRQQVAAELASDLKPLDGYETSEAGYLEMLRAKENNRAVYARATRLGIDLPAPSTSSQ